MENNCKDLQLEIYAKSPPVRKTLNAHINNVAIAFAYEQHIINNLKIT